MGEEVSTDGRLFRHVVLNIEVDVGKLTSSGRKDECKRVAVGNAIASEEPSPGEEFKVPELQ